MDLVEQNGEPQRAEAPGRAPESEAMPAAARQSGVGEEPPARAASSRQGFYAPHMNARELRDLDAALSNGLEDEIAMLKVYTRRVFLLAQEVEDIEEAAALLKVISMSAVRIATLKKAQQTLLGKRDSISEAISQALAEVAQELNIHV